ncbi:MAG: DNA polymerase III subunit gamma/tau [Hyphomicrobium sp.]|jgi:DNA polymerase-3 subunit gamma/tau
MAKKPASNEAVSGGASEASVQPYVVLARKYRPQTFDDLIGQEAMVQTLRNAFASGRIAHGYMLTGVRGVGKTTTARILARALNYETDAVARPTIDMPELGRHCAAIMESRHLDVIEMDAASNTGVENMREIISNAQLRPSVGRYKVFIIDEVHMLSKGAFNALLKTLEEPREFTKFIFATTEIRKVPVTVLSRCQRFDLRRVDVARLTQHLKSIAANEGAAVDDDALTLISRAAEGSVRDALSILDQAIVTSIGTDAGRGTVSASDVRAMLGLADRGRIFDLLGELVSGEAAGAIAALEGLFRDGADAVQVLADLAEAVHITARAKAIGPDAVGEGLSAEEKRRAASLGGRLSMALLARLWQMLLKGIEETGRAPNPMAAAEMVLIRIAYTSDLPPPDEVIRALGGANALPRRASVPASNSAVDATARLATTDAAAPQPARSAVKAEPPFPYEPFAADIELDELEVQDADSREGMETLADAHFVRPLNTFADVLALAGERRDAKLKVNLEEQVSLVKFDGAAGSIDLYLMPGARPEIANDLREKLNKWTQRRWMIALSKAPGEPPIGRVRRERAAAEMEALKKHPAVAAVLEAFPEAQIAAVRQLAMGRDDDTATG